jgi:hypothetical protein
MKVAGWQYLAPALGEQPGVNQIGGQVDGDGEDGNQ